MSCSRVLLAAALAVASAWCVACGDDGSGADTSSGDHSADDGDAGADDETGRSGTEPVDVDEDPGPDSDDSGPDTDDTPSDTASEGDSSVGGPDAADDADPPPDCEAELQLGDHPTGETDITTFTPFGPDAELCVELGTQGFLMTVYGFRTRCGIDEPFSLCVDIKLEGEVLGDVCLKKQKWTGVDDDWNYYLNIFLVVAASIDEFKDANAYYGETATVSVSMEDDDGDIVEGTADAVLMDCWGACQIPED